MLESLTSEMSKLKIENKQPIKGKGSYEYPHRNPNQNPNNFRRNNQQVQISKRERNPTEDQRVKDPLQNVVMDKDEDDFQEEEEEDNIHCVGDDVGKSYLTQHDYEEALMNEQINENSIDNSLFQTDDKNKYNLRSKFNTAKQSALSPPKKTVAPAKQQTQKYQIPNDLQIPLKAPSNENTPVPPKKTVAPTK
jgi:hypothetical protein